MLLAAFALALSLVVAATTPAAPPLPPTQPGSSHDEGWFLFTSADDGSRAVYFIAGNTRHSILPSDVQLELQANPLWPERQATPDEVLGFPEGAPIGTARSGLLGAADAPQASPLAEEPAATPAGEPAVYVMRRGDTLTHIAAEYGTSVDAILAANGLSNPNRVEAGQWLLIPSDGEVTAPEVPDTVAEDAAPTDVEAEEPTADIPTATTYTVLPGDSAFKIARRFGIDQQALLDANGISNPNRVFAGQVLTIPNA